jgi:hypothetical protein
MRRYGDDDPANAVILVRVYHIQSDVGIKFYPNPWRLYLDGVLDFRSKDGYQGHFVGQSA